MLNKHGTFWPWPWELKCSDITQTTIQCLSTCSNTPKSLWAIIHTCHPQDPEIYHSPGGNGCEGDWGPQSLWFKSAASCEHLLEQEPSIHPDLALSLLWVWVISSALPCFLEWGHQVLWRQISQTVPLEQKRGKLVFKAALGGCSLFLVLFKAACADCSCEMVWNGEHWCEYREKHLLVLPGWDCFFSDFQIRERAAGGEFQGKGMCIREENGFGFKCSSSLCPVEGICKTYQKQNIKSISSSEQLTPLALLFLDVLTHSPSLLSPKGCSYSVLCVAFEISKATCVKEKGISRRREASSAWWCLEPTAGPWPGALSLFYGSAPFPWGFSAECWMHWMVPLSCSLWPFPEAGQCSQVQQGPGQQPLQPGRNSSSLGKGCALTVSREGQPEPCEIRMLLEGLEPPHTKMGTGIQHQGSDAETSAWDKPKKIPCKACGLLSQYPEACPFCMSVFPVIFVWLQLLKQWLVHTGPLLELGPYYKHCNSENCSTLQTENIPARDPWVQVGFMAAGYFMVLLPGCASSPGTDVVSQRQGAKARVWDINDCVFAVQICLYSQGDGQGAGARARRASSLCRGTCSNGSGFLSLGRWTPHSGCCSKGRWQLGTAEQSQGWAGQPGDALDAQTRPFLMSSFPHFSPQGEETGWGCLVVVVGTDAVVWLLQLFWNWCFKAVFDVLRQIDVSSSHYSAAF